jgi:hypothetical protein
MSTLPARLALPLALALLSPGPAAAITPPQIDKVRIGLPVALAGQEAGRSRNGAWAPVYVTLKAGTEGNPQGAYRLAVETTDSEDAPCRSTAPVPALAAGEERAALAYVVPASDGAEFKVTLESADGKVLQTLARLTRDAGQDQVVPPGNVLFLTVGPGLAQLKEAARKLDRPAPGAPQADDERGRRQFVQAETVAALPDRWFGYDAVDVVVLGTGSRALVEGLLQEGAAARRSALLEWVRRGGRLIVSVGRNHQAVAQLLQKMPLLDCPVTGSATLEALPNLSAWAKGGAVAAPLEKVEVATLKPGPGTHVLIRDGGRPVLVQGSCGLGRVVLAAIDLDGPPFTTWEGREALWQKLQGEATPAPPAPPAGTTPNEIRAEMKRSLETFEEVPVVSFGWVALFVLFYIALVGPLDYFVLKKLFKRLELTWVTFPLTVLIVSVAAYATAYALKGDELRINKVDVVDIDLHGPTQVHGTTWLTLFSPRIANYTVGVTPAPAWAQWKGPGALVTVLEGGDQGLRTGSQGLFPKPYEYAEDGAGLRRVPVPVWATRAFTATWRAPLPGVAPIDTRDEVGPLRASRTGDGLVGRITNNLPVELQGVTLFYREKCYDLGTLAPGEARRVEPLFSRDARGQARDLVQWFADPGALAPASAVAPDGQVLGVTVRARSESLLIKPLLFYRAADNATLVNGGLRTFDQSWRLRHQTEFPPPERTRYRDEVIVVARTPLVSGRAEAVSEHAATSSRLWLGALPAADAQRPALPGLLTQETYVRVFIPVKSGQ